MSRSRAALEAPFVIRPIRGHQPTAFSLGQVLITCSHALVRLVSESLQSVCTHSESLLWFFWMGAARWRQQQARPTREWSLLALRMRVCVHPAV